MFVGCSFLYNRCALCVCFFCGCIRQTSQVVLVVVFDRLHLKHAKTDFFKMTKWYFRPKWKFNTWTDFLSRTKRRNFYVKDNILIINEMWFLWKMLKKCAGRKFLTILSILIRRWLLMNYNQISCSYSQMPPKHHPFFSFCLDTFSKLRIIHFLTFLPKQTVFFSAFQCFFLFSALF